VCVLFTESTTLKEDQSDCQQEYATIWFVPTSLSSASVSYVMREAISFLHVTKNVGKRTFSLVRVWCGYTAGGGHMRVFY